jgi:hypothetical protein
MLITCQRVRRLTSDHSRLEAGLRLRLEQAELNGAARNVEPRTPGYAET